MKSEILIKNKTSSNYSNTALYPYLLYSIFFMILPIVTMIFFSLKKRNIYGGIIDSWDYSAWIKIFEYQTIYIIIKSFSVSVGVTFLCIIISYFIIMYLITKSSKFQHTIIMLFLIPVLIDILIKITGYMIFFGKNGFFNEYLIYFRLINSPLNFFFSLSSIVIGFLIQYMPYSLTFLWISISKIEKNLIQSAKDLGANDTQLFFSIMLPLSKKALLISSVFIFTSSITNSSIPELIGGLQNLFVSKLVISQFFEMSNWPLGSAIALTLFFISIVFTITVNELINRFL